MKFLYSKKFKELFCELPLSIRRKFAKQIRLFEQNPKHPSLQAKKMQGHNNIWEARLDYHYRFTFNWEGDSITLRVVGHHDEALKNP